jgi:hypothetical protein
MAQEEIDPDRAKTMLPEFGRDEGNTTARGRMLQLIPLLKKGYRDLTPPDLALVITALERAGTTPVVMVPVAKSSNIVGLGYDKDYGELHVAFKDATYVYFEVPEETCIGLMAADSKGSYLHANIKGKHKYKKVGGAPSHGKAAEERREAPAPGTP